MNLRVPAADRGLIDRAARVSGKTRTQFVLDAARRAAEETLLDRAIYRVSPERYAAFIAALDAPAAPNERLRKTMRATPPWSST
ncbi:MAG: DUF1778 domain-containing protein [Variovorax sp.]